MYFRSLHIALSMIEESQMTGRERKASVLFYQVFLEMPVHFSEVYIAQINEKMSHLQLCVGTVTL